MIVSSIMHGIVFFYGLWLLSYRNRGLNKGIFTELFVSVGTGIRPKPMDCLIFFTGLASLEKIGINVMIYFDVLPEMLWVRIIVEQLYWIIVTIGFSTYFVGLLYAMPVTTREGIFAVYHPETGADTHPLSPIHIITPTTVQKNFLLVMGAVYPTFFASTPGVLSALFLQKPGYGRISHILLIVQYANWVVILWTMSMMFFYYGLKYTFILRANIIIAEAALKAPKAAFGISNLRSSSPARFLFFQLQFTGFAGAAVTLLAGSLCLIWCVWRDDILSMKSDPLPHTMAFFWTCAIALLYFLTMWLIAIQSMRNRARASQGSSGSQSHTAGQSSSQKNASSHAKSLYSAQHQIVRTESEARLAQRSSAEMSTLNSIESAEKDSFDIGSYGAHDVGSLAVKAMYDASNRMELDAFSASHNANKMEKEKNVGFGSPSRPFVIKSHLSGESFESADTFGRRDSDASFALGSKIQPDLRQTVFGGRPKSNSPLLPPSSLTPTSPSFPLVALRPAPRHSKETNRNLRSPNLNPAVPSLSPGGTTYVNMPVDGEVPHYNQRARVSRGSRDYDYFTPMPTFQPYVASSYEREAPVQIESFANGVFEQFSDVSQSGGGDRHEYLRTGNGLSWPPSP
ncbi:hypothetical protein BGZ49_007410 [Haplosporangium sp. Z 27]|nr:hypothetical protein BGZ49_007410 [Haplosporangium sp. Z 27]